MNILKLKPSYFYLPVLMLVALISCQDISEEEQSFIADDPQYSSLDQQFQHYEIIKIDNKKLWDEVKNQISGEVSINFGDFISSPSSISSWTFKLFKKEVEAPDFKLLEAVADGEFKEVEMAETHVLMGKSVLTGKSVKKQANILLGITEENVRFHVAEDDNIYMLEPVTDYVSSGQKDEYIKYEVSDLINTKDHVCGVEDDHSLQIDLESIPSTNKSSANYIVEVSALGDFALYKKFWRNGSYTSSWMYWRIVNASLRYHHYGNFPLELRIKSIMYYPFQDYIGTATDANPFLDSWFSFVKRNSWLPKGDVTLLFTGTDKVLGTQDIVGHAFWGTICEPIAPYNSGPVAFVEHQWSTYNVDNVVAHEVGHILGHQGHSVGYLGGFMTVGVADWRLTTAVKSVIQTFLNNYQNSRCL